LLAERASGDAAAPRGYPHERPRLLQLRWSCLHPQEAEIFVRRKSILDSKETIYTQR
jgi:hypothetical protein